MTSLPNEKIDLSVTDRGKQLHISCARNEATMAGMDAEDFPPVPKVADGLSLKLDQKALRRAIQQTHFAAAADDTRPVLTGIHTLVEGSQLTLAAADGFRLAVHKLPIDQDVPEKVEVIVPARAFREVERLIGDGDGTVEMAINEARSQVVFRMDTVELVATLLQGTFPNYGQLIPQSFASRATINMQQFLQETRISSIFARDGAGIVRIQIDPTEEKDAAKMTISARAEEIGEHRGEMDVKMEGEAAKIAFNSRYLQDVLAVLDAEEIALETTNPSSPGVLRPLNGDDYVHVVMPMFVQW